MKPMLDPKRALPWLSTFIYNSLSFYQERGDLGQLKELSRDLDFPLTAYGFSAQGWAFSSGTEQANALVLAKSSLDLAHAAGCDGPYLTGPVDSGDLHQAARAFRELSQYAEHLGMRLALEFMGVGSQVKNINLAWELLELAGVESAGIALDSYHFCAGGSSWKDLEAFPTSRILVAHLADAPADLSDPFPGIRPQDARRRRAAAGEVRQTAGLKRVSWLLACRMYPGPRLCCRPGRGRRARSLDHSSRRRTGAGRALGRFNDLAAQPVG